MAVAKPLKTEQRKVQGPEWEPQVEQTALLASPSLQAGGEEKEHIKRRAKIEMEASLLFTSFGSNFPNILRMYFPLFSK